MDIDAADSFANELEKRITEAFLIFDHHGTKSVDVREVGTIIRYLGCVPTEAEINEIISATEMDDSNGSVHLARFLPHVRQLLIEHKMEPAAPEQLLEAFRVLDPQQRGWLDRGEIGRLFADQGEPFTEDELDEMMMAAVDAQSGPGLQRISYAFYINALMVDM